MKFGSYLETHLRPEWKQYYIDYKKLKSMIKALSEVESAGYDVAPGQGERQTSLSMVPLSNITAKYKGKPITEDDFFHALEDEMAKIEKFALGQMDGINSRDEELRSRVLNANPNILIDDVKAKKNDINDLDVKTGMTAAEREKWMKEAKQLGDDFLQLEKFVNMNYLGFFKILKKHDKLLPIPCQRFYMTKLHSSLWIRRDYSKTFVHLSEIHAKLRGDVAAKNENLAGQSFVRSTTKYWVKTGDISKVKHIILQNLPVFQHKLEALQGDSQLTNSVYFDNTQLELYHGRLDKVPAAIAIRLRWYETDVPDLVFVERKTHYDSWTGDESVKERFTLKEKQVIPFLKGEFTVQDKINEMTAAGKSPKDIETVRKLFTEIYMQIDSKQLRPTLRTQYMRVAYQIPFDATVRISLDTNLVMLTENPQVGKDCLTSGRWYRDPDLPLPPTEFTMFPHAILEVKLSLKKDQQAPDWVSDLIRSELVTRVHKFSKFIHGCATLLSKNVQAVPYWVDDESIRASMVRSLPKEHVRKNGRDEDAILLFGEGEAINILPRKDSMYGSMEQDDGQDDKMSIKEVRAKMKADNELALKQSRQQVRFQRENDPLLGGHAHSHESDGSNISNSITSKIKKLFGFGSHDGDPEHEYYNQKNKENWKVRRTPMRIEPKTYFSNERTFISWLHMSITLGSMSAVLLGLSSQNFDDSQKVAGDELGVSRDAQRSVQMTKLVGMLLLPVSILFVVYALTVFYWRGKHIRERVDNDLFHDRVGPLVLGLVLLAALLSIFALFISNGELVKL